MPAPASHRFCETVLSYSGLNPSKICDAAVVCTPCVANRSFMPIGTPAILPKVLPAARSASTFSAAASAWSGVVTMKALSAAASATAALKLSATSRAVNSPLATPSRMCLTPRSAKPAITRSPSARQRSRALRRAHWRVHRHACRRLSADRHRPHHRAGAVYSG